MKKTAIELRNVSYQYDKSKELLHKISLAIPEHTITTILGKNGVGKTTLLNCVLGFINKYEGDITFFGKPQSEFSKRELAQVVGYVPQLSNLSFDYTVEEFVLMGCSPSMHFLDMPDIEKYSIVEQSLKLLEIYHLKDRTVNSLSGGEKQLAYIARAISQQPKIILFDEPTSALDFGNSLRITDLMLRLRDQGFTIILTCHDPDIPFLFDDYTIAMMPQNKVLYGKSRDLLTDSVLSELYGTPIKRVKIKETNHFHCIRATDLAVSEEVIHTDENIG